MPWLVDGSNVLGALRWDRESRESKEKLTTLAARFARSKRSKLVLVFDGSAPSPFAKSLGSVSVRFSGKRSADDVITDLAHAAHGSLMVVTADRQLANRVKRRAVEVVSPREFAAQLESVERAAEDGGTGDTDDWTSYFSDPNNRKF